jgi:hypothetical protein
MEEAMIKYIFKLIVSIFCVLYLVSVAEVWAAANMFTGTLSCSTIGPSHPEHTEASGEFLFQLDESKQELTYKIQVENIENAFMAHIHVGPCDEKAEKTEIPSRQGPIAAWLYSCNSQEVPNQCIKGEFTGTLAEGVIKPCDLKNSITFEELIKAMREGYAYVNVHTRKYIMCEICGRVIPVK